MVPQLSQKPQITEIHVRMDCNGCVQKIKRALSGISGIYDLYIDLPQQKITIVGCADPEKIVKAIKKTRKIATICNIEPIDSPPPPPRQQQAERPSSSSQQTGQENEANAKSPELAEAATQTHQTEEEEEEAAPTAHPRPLEEPSKDTPPQEQPQNEPTRQENNACQHPPTSTQRTRDVGEAHVAHHHPRTRDVGEVHHVTPHHHHHPSPNYGIGNRYGYGYGYGYGQSYVGQWDRYHNNSLVFHQQEPSQPIHVTHSYNAYMPSPYVTEYEYVRSPPRFHTHYNNHRMEYYSGDYYYHNGGNSNSNGNGNGNITSMFSDENPNACRIV